MLEAGVAPDDVVDHRRALGRDVQAHRPLPLLAAAVTGRGSVDLLVRAHVIRRRRRSVRVTGPEQRPQRLLVAGGAVGLQDRALVPVKLQPSEGVEDLLDVLRGGALAVGVLDPQHHLAPVVAGQEPVEQGGASAADVERTRGRRREADPHVGCSVLRAPTPGRTTGGSARPRASIIARDADRRPRVPRRRSAEGGRARSGAQLRGDPDLQPVAADVERARVRRGGGRRLPRGALGQLGQGGRDPRDLPAELSPARTATCAANRCSR